MNRRMSDLEKLEILDKYKTGLYSCNALARHYGLTHGIVNQFLRKNNVEIDKRASANRKYVFNERFFDQIDTEEKAYFLGLLYADGCNGEESASIRLSLQEQDVGIINRFSNALFLNKPLKYIERSKENPKWKNVYLLNIFSRHMSNQLANLGCTQAKSLTLKFPTVAQLQHDLTRHFIRGYFDGDGHLGIYDVDGKNWKMISMSIVSTEEFCTTLQSIVLKELGVKSSITIRHKDRNNSTRSFIIGGRNKIYKFLDWIYEGATVFLQRKYDKFLYGKTTKTVPKVLSKLQPLTIGNKTQQVKDWLAEYKTNIMAVRQRLKSGMLLEEAITKPKKQYNLKSCKTMVTIN